MKQGPDKRLSLDAAKGCGLRAPSAIETLAREVAQHAWLAAYRSRDERDGWIADMQERLVALVAAVLAIVLPRVRRPSAAERADASAGVLECCLGYEPGTWNAVIAGDHDHGQERRCKHCDGFEHEHRERADTESTTAGVVAHMPGGADLVAEIDRRRSAVRERMARLTSYDQEDGRALVAQLLAADEAERALLRGDVTGAQDALERRDTLPEDDGLRAAETRRDRPTILPPEPADSAEERAGWPTPKGWAYPAPGLELTFSALRRANVLRCEHSFHRVDQWSPTDWAAAATGEIGELCNLLKKLRRGERVDRQDLGHELADTVIYLDLLAARLGLDLGAAVVTKFDLVSDQVTSPIKLGSRAFTRADAMGGTR